MIGLIKDYSGMLRRIACAAFVVCMLIAYLVLPPSSTAVHQSLESLNLPMPSEFLGFKGLLPLYFIVGVAGLLVSRVLHLHNLLSDWLGIRKRFDCEFILRPLAERIGINLSEASINAIEKNRTILMQRAFYEYANPHNPLINEHLIQRSLDYWSWYWIVIESVFFCLIGLGVSIALCNPVAVGVLLPSVLVLFLMTLVYPTRRSRAARAQIDDILRDSSRERAVMETFHSCGIK
jgi:fatty acid desaturase